MPKPLKCKFIVRSLPCWTLAVTAVVAGACGPHGHTTKAGHGDAGQTVKMVSRRIDHTGGTVTLMQGPVHGVSVTIPAGALARPAMITIRTGDASPKLPPGLLSAGPEVVFGPEGQTFAKPVTITVPITGTGATGLYTRPLSSQQWTAVPSARYDAAKKVVVADVMHFSGYKPTNTSDFSGVGYVLKSRVEGADDQTYECTAACTATLVSPNIALTEASCVDFTHSFAVGFGDVCDSSGERYTNARCPRGQTVNIPVGGNISFIAPSHDHIYRSQVLALNNMPFLSGEGLAVLWLEGNVPAEVAKPLQRSVTFSASTIGCDAYMAGYKPGNPQKWYNPFTPPSTVTTITIHGNDLQKQSETNPGFQSECIGAELDSTNKLTSNLQCAFVGGPLFNLPNGNVLLIGIGSGCDTMAHTLYTPIFRVETDLNSAIDHFKDKTFDSNCSRITSPACNKRPCPVSACDVQSDGCGGTQNCGVINNMCHVDNDDGEDGE